MLYLKYRPQTIGELDNERIKQTLGKALLENQFTHAYLLIGTRGSGKTTTARLIAKIVNCTNRKKGEEPCNKCDSCVAITEGRSLDVIEIDAASNTGVEDIRELRERVKLAPTSSEYKVYIIDEVHMLSNSAFNALLKTLEEPPEHVIFVLATTDPQKLPATIVSRCLVYDFGMASDEEIVGSVKRVATGEKIEISDEAHRLIAKKAKGSLRDAHKIVDQLTTSGTKIGAQDVLNLEGVREADEVSSNILAALSKKDLPKSLELIEKYVSQGGRVKELVISLLNLFRNILLSRSGVPVEAEEANLDTGTVRNLINQLIECSALTKDSPVAQLPLELVIIEYCSSSQLSVLSSQFSDSGQSVVGLSDEKTEELKTEKPSSDDRKQRTDDKRVETKEIIAKWPEILAAVKPLNNSLLALLRAARPKSLEENNLTIEVFYKFHNDKLAEIKNRGTLEGVVSGIMGKEIKVKFELVEKK